jgi:DNA-binding transcriptional regulator YiaG
VTGLLHAIEQRTSVRDIAAWLRRMRRELRISQSKAAAAANVTRNTFSSWERARTVPTVTQIEQLRIFEKNLRRAKGLR